MVGLSNHINEVFFWLKKIILIFLGFSQVASARIFNTLMTQRLNFSKYIAHGGDWGSLNVKNIAHLFPKKYFYYKFFLINFFFIK